MSLLTIMIVTTVCIKFPKPVVSKSLQGQGANAAFLQKSHSHAAALVQVLQAQSAASSQQSQAVDYQAGIEAMVLAILQQTNYSQHVMLATLASLSVLTSQDQAVRDALQLAAYSAYLNDALDANANFALTVETSLLNMTSSWSLLPVRQQANSIVCNDCPDKGSVVASYICEVSCEV